MAFLGLLGSSPGALEHQFGRCSLSAPCQQPAAATRRSRQQALVVRASRVADPVLVDLKSFQGESVGKELLALKTADADTARGLVHRYIVMIQQNQRRVRPPCLVFLALCVTCTPSPRPLTHLHKLAAE